MTRQELNLVKDYVNEHIGYFHGNRLRKIKEISLNDVLRRKNPYLFRAKNISRASDLTASILDAFLSSSEEELFGNFLEGLAIRISEISCRGQKSSSQGIDLDLTRDGIRYLVAIKSGPNWGNSSQYGQLRADFATALKVLHQSKSAGHIQPVLGMCYGRLKPKNTGLYLKLAGQAFWEFVSGDRNLYIDLVEPLGYEAKKHYEAYIEEKNAAYNRFERDLLNTFCDGEGQIDWPKLIHFNSGNLADE